MKKIAIVGATGAVGQAMIKELEKSSLDFADLFFFAKETEKTITFRKKEYPVLKLDDNSFSFYQMDFVLFAAGGDISAHYAPIAAKLGITVIDNSSYFRMKEGVPLVVPEVNPEDLKDHKGIIANPNCSTIQMMLPLKALHDFSPIKRVIVSTYQAVSGAGILAINELKEQEKALSEGKKPISKVFPKQIAENMIPQIDVFMDNYFTKEEMKMVEESNKILHANVHVTATCVRVPVVYGHSESIYLTTEKMIGREKAIELMENFPNLIVSKGNDYFTPAELQEESTTYISRVREDLSNPYGLNFWCVANNIFKGAASNAVQILAYLMD